MTIAARSSSATKLDLAVRDFAAGMVNADRSANKPFKKSWAHSPISLWSDRYSNTGLVARSAWPVGRSDFDRVLHGFLNSD